jgi:hypothetical protein
MSATANRTTLPAQPRKSNLYPRGQAVFGICALVILLLLFNYYPQRIGFWVSATDGLSFLPVLSPAFFAQYLPWINLCWMLALGLNIAHLSLGRWTLATRLVDMGLAFLALNVVVAMIFGPSIFAIDLQAADLAGAWTATAQVVASVLSMVTPFVLGVIALALVIDMIKKVVDLVQSIST